MYLLSRSGAGGAGTSHPPAGNGGVGAGTAITVGDIVDSILKATDKNPKVVYDETKPTTIPPTDPTRTAIQTPMEISIKSIKK